jgi:hypothetical protein
LYEKDECFTILNSEYNYNNNDFTTEMMTTEANAVDDQKEETEELKTTSFEFDFTQLIEFEETTEFFPFEHITTDFNFEFEEIVDL